MQKVIGDKNKTEEFLYCSLRKCPNSECIRHNSNTPFEKTVLRTRFRPDKEWNCEDMII